MDIDGRKEENAKLKTPRLRSGTEKLKYPKTSAPLGLKNNYQRKLKFIIYNS
jgi:hypothetical protein